MTCFYRVSKEAVKLREKDRERERERATGGVNFHFSILKGRDGFFFGVPPIETPEASAM